MKMKYPLMVFAVATLILPMTNSWSQPVSEWTPPEKVSREEILATSRAVLSRPELQIQIFEDIFRIQAVGLDWDFGGMVYEPIDQEKIPVGPDGRKIGAFLIHGGSGDHRFMDDVARLMAGRFGFKVVTMSLPGRINLNDPGRDWPGDTINADGTIRTPIWKQGEIITPDQYEVVQDDSARLKYGTLIMGCAKEDSVFHARMSGWPVAFEEAGRAMIAKHMPSSDYSVYVHGRSTGGPFSFLLTQRVPNVVGVIGMENTPFGYIFRIQSRPSGNAEGLTYGDIIPFNCLQIRTWRDAARMLGPEALLEEGPTALNRLPMLIEEVMEEWRKEALYPGFKAEGMIHFGVDEQLKQAAMATANRLGLDQAETDQLIKKYVNYCCELKGPGVKPVPPIIFGVAASSPDHEAGNYKEHTIPLFREMNPAPKVHLVEFGAGIHFYTRPEPGLPVGVAPAVVKLWYDAIMNGYYNDYSRKWGDNTSTNNIRQLE